MSTFKTWIDRLYDARFSAEETTEWENLVDEGLTYDAATATLIERRREKSLKEHLTD